MLRIVLALLILFAPLAHSEESGPRPNENKAETPQANDKNGAGAPQASAPSAPIPAPIVNVYTAKHAGEESHCAQPKDWKEWPAFSWCKTDAWLDAERVIALFTVILGVATWLLWRATKKLVEGAEETSIRQLRAYVSVTPHKVLNWTNNVEAVGVTLNYKNHGQTPALEVDFAVGIRKPDSAQWNWRYGPRHNEPT